VEQDADSNVLIPLYPSASTGRRPVYCGGGQRKVRKCSTSPLDCALADPTGLLTRLDHQDAGCETLLLACASRGEALGGNQGFLSAGLGEPVVEAKVRFGISVLHAVIRAVKEDLDSPEVKSSTKPQ
jgi:hypothetical protein